MKTTLLIIALALGARLPSLAAPLTESTYTEVIKDVATVDPAGNAVPAGLNEVVKAPERIRTGPESRAELTAPDQTVTRVGANTIFSFADNGRTLNLEQGNLLFHAPKGLGGGVIKSGGASAAVLGTTLIVSATPNGGFKVILLEGSGTVKLPDGASATLHAGQLVFVLPGGKLSPVLTINLGKLVGGSLLLTGFSHDLSSWPLIQAAIQAQAAEIKSGKAKDTGLPVEVFLNPPGNGLDVMSPGTYQVAVPQPLSPSQYNLVLFGSGPEGTFTGYGGSGGRGTAPTQFPPSTSPP